jgi:hypothetical protein
MESTERRSSIIKRRKRNGPKLSRTSQRGHHSKRHRPDVHVSVFPTDRSGTATIHSAQTPSTKDPINKEKQLRNKADYAAAKCAKKEEVVVSLLEETKLLKAQNLEKDVQFQKLKGEKSIAESHSAQLSTTLRLRADRFTTALNISKEKHKNALTVSTEKHKKVLTVSTEKHKKALTVSTEKHKKALSVSKEALTVSNEKHTKVKTKAKIDIIVEKEKGEKRLCHSQRAHKASYEKLKVRPHIIFCSSLQLFSECILILFTLHSF